MIVQILFNRGTAVERELATRAARLEAAGVKCELVDADTPTGIAMAQTYDIMARPALLLLQSDGSLAEVWTELDRFPPVDEIAYRART